MLLRWRHRHTTLRTKCMCHSILHAHQRSVTFRYCKDAKITIECRHQAASVVLNIVHSKRAAKRNEHKTWSMMKEKYCWDSFDARRNLCWISTQINRNVMCLSPLIPLGAQKNRAQKSVCISIFHLQSHTGKCTSIGSSYYVSDGISIWVCREGSATHRSK